ncbi:MAG TPA: hypothetical protein VFP10_00325, partial [Candidatus Eisenbacteria bacterium]|nr:hypothetical protein [Candidatus Eisenbacteria bacterium]
IALRKDTITYYSPHHLRSLFYYIIKQGDVGPLLFFLSNAVKAKPDVSFLRDPAGYLSLLFRFLRPRSPRQADR